MLFEYLLIGGVIVGIVGAIGFAVLGELIPFFWSVFLIIVCICYSLDLQNRGGYIMGFVYDIEVCYKCDQAVCGAETDCTVQNDNFREAYNYANVLGR